MEIQERLEGAQSKTTALSEVATGVAARAAILKGFSELPDDARVGWEVVAALDDCSEATVWRRVRSGLLPPPERQGRRHTRWVVGQLRNRSQAG